MWEPQANGSLPEQGMSGAAGRQKKVTSDQSEEALLRQSCHYATPVEAQCPATIDPYYVGVADYDAMQCSFGNMAMLL